MGVKLGKFGTAHGTLYRRKGKNGKEGGCWYAQWMHNGKRFQVSTHTAVEKEARRILGELTKDFNVGDEAAIRETVRNNLEKARAGRLPLAGAFDTFLAKTSERLEETTLATNRSRFNVFLAWMERNRPETKFADALTPAEAIDFLNDITKDKSDKTFNDYRAFLLQIWKSLVEFNLADTNPWALIKRRKGVKQVKHKAFHEDDLPRLLAATDGEMRVLFNIGVNTGMRLKDAVLLKWRQVDFRHGKIEAKPFKTAKYKTEVEIIMTQDLANALMDAMSAAGAVSDSDYVMPELAHRYERQPRGVTKSIQRIIRKAGFDTGEERDRGRTACRYGFHSLRHSFATIARAHGIPLSSVRDVLGHKSEVMTSHYTEQTDEERRRDMAKFPAILPAADTPAGLIPEKADGQGAQVAADSPAMRAFRAAVNSMTAEERETARKILAGLA